MALAMAEAEMALAMVEAVAMAVAEAAEVEVVAMVTAQGAEPSRMAEAGIQTSSLATEMFVVPTAAEEMLVVLVVSTAATRVRLRGQWRELLRGMEVCQTLLEQ